MSSTSLVFDILARDRASSTFDRLGGSSTRLGGHLSNLGGKLKTLAKYGALAAAAGAVLAVKWGVDAVKAAAADDQAQKILANALKRNTDATNTQVAAVEDWIAAQGVALGVADDDLRPAYQRLAEATGSISKAQRLASLAMDVAAGKGKTTKQVSEALAKAYEGNIGALGRLGVKTKDAEGNTLTFEQATKSLADTFAGQAATKADTYQGKMDRLKVIYEETKESIGNKLLPVLTDLATWFLEDGIPAISKTYDWLKGKLGPVFEWIGGVVAKFRSKGGEASVMMDRFHEVIGTVKNALRDAGPFFDLVGGMAKNVGVVMQEVLWPAFKKISGWLLGNGLDGLKRFGKALGVVGELGIAMWNNALQPVFKFLANGIADILFGWSKMLGAMGNVPGFGWAKDAADKMERAGEKARAIADGLNKIPRNVPIDVTIYYHHVGQIGTNAGNTDLQLPGNPRPTTGGGGRRGGRMVQERGGRMTTTGGSDVSTVAAAMRAALDGLTVNINGDGTATFLLTGASYA